MNYRAFTKNTIPISEIGLGGWQLGHNSGWNNLSEKKAISLVEKALELNINFFDTAPNYGLGTSEVRFGKALKTVDRDKIVINTKFGHTDSGTINFSADYIRASLEGSLKRLKTDYVDSLIIHNPPIHILDGTQNDHYEILERLIDEGKIKAYGASLDTYKELKLLLDTTNAKVIEAFFNILHQDVGRGFDLAKSLDVGIIVKIPLDSGWLSGKYCAQSTFNGVRSRWTGHDIETRARLVRQIKSILQTDEHLAQKALAFCLGHTAVSTVIPGSINIIQLTDNVESTLKPLSKETILTLETFFTEKVKDLMLPW